MVNENQKEADFLFRMVKERYENLLSAEELEEVLKGVEGITKDAEALRSVKLGNNNDPFFIFKPFLKGA